MAMISLIAAMGAGGEIGRGGELPWGRMRADMQRFRRLTMGNVLVMGRKTWEGICSLPMNRGKRPLEGRAVVVVSATGESNAAAGIYICRDLTQAFSIAGGLCDVSSGTPQPKVMIAGGASIYDACLEMAHEMHVTLVTAKYPYADKFFPERWQRTVMQGMKIVSCETVEEGVYNEHGSVYLHLRRE